MFTRMRTLKVMVDEAWIEQAGPNQTYSVPDVSGTATVDKRTALYHARNGSFVFAIVHDMQAAKKKP